MNYQTLHTVADVSRMLKIDKHLLKSWIYIFKEYLTESVNPPKGGTRTFQLEDIRVLAFISFYWEEHPDIEYIKQCINCNDHYDIDVINKFILELSSFATEIRHDIDLTRTDCAIVHGMSAIADIFDLACSYKNAGDLLIDSAIKSQESWTLLYPALYNYRHAIELFMKAVIPKYKHNHDLKKLFANLEKLIFTKFRVSIPDWFKVIIMTFDDLDADGTTFRYGGGAYREEILIDLHLVKEKMQSIEVSFKLIQKQNQL